MSDLRPRFGWCDDLDLDPQYISEKRVGGGIYVAVIPMPFNSGKIRKEVREFTTRLHKITK